MLSKSTLLKIVINTAIGLVLILVWLQFVDIKEIWGTLSKVNPLSLIPIFLVMLGSPIIRAYRLKVLLSPLKKIPLKDLVYLTGVAMMLSFFIPIRAGEIAKGIYLNGEYDLPIGKSIIWVLLDRFIDFLVVLALSGVLLLLIPTRLSGNIAILTFILALVIMVVFYLMVYKSNLARKMSKFLSYLLVVNIITKYFERITNFFLEAFTILKRSPKDWAVLILLTVMAYAADAGIWYFSFQALGVNPDFIKMYLAQLLSAITYLVPAAPGYVGSAEASGILIFAGVFGMDPNLSSAMTVLFHVCTLLFILIFGVVSTYLLKIDLGKILRQVFRKGNKGD